MRCSSTASTTTLDVVPREKWESSVGIEVETNTKRTPVDSAGARFIGDFTQGMMHPPEQGYGTKALLLIAFVHDFKVGITDGLILRAVG